jgi:hypothetical protein
VTRTVLILALAAAIGALSGSSHDARGQGTPSASRVIDQTFVCTTGVRAGVRKIDLRVTPGARHGDFPNRWLWLTGMVIGTPSTDPTAGGLLHISAGRGGLPPPNAGEDGGLGVSSKRCRATQARVPLSSRGLSGGPVVFEAEYECFPPRTLLVRVRGSFRKPTRLKRDRFGYLATSEGPRDVEFAMRTPVGRTLVYGSVSDSGKTRLFLARDCVRD